MDFFRFVFHVLGIFQFFSTVGGDEHDSFYCCFNLAHNDCFKFFHFLSLLTLRIFVGLSELDLGLWRFSKNDGQWRPAICINQKRKTETCTLSSTLVCNCCNKSSWCQNISTQKPWQQVVRPKQLKKNCRVIEINKKFLKIKENGILALDWNNFVENLKFNCLACFSGVITCFSFRLGFIVFHNCVYYWLYRVNSKKYRILEKGWNNINLVA